MTAAEGAAAERIVITPRERRDAVIDFIDSAKSHLSLAIFRCDDDAVLEAVGRGVRRGVHVRTLVTDRAKGSKRYLKALRKQLTALGADVRRYADPVVRYHAKYGVADDRRTLVASLNFTRKCFRDTCDFLLVSEDATLARDALRLFDLDWEARATTVSDFAGDRLIVGPERARERFAALIGGATDSIRLIDPKISDAAMLKLLGARQAEGLAVDIRDSGYLGSLLPHGKLLMVDNSVAVIGSIALSTLALEFRRELAVVVRDRRSLAILQEFWESLPARSLWPASSLIPEERVQ